MPIGGVAGFTLNGFTIIGGGTEGVSVGGGARDPLRGDSGRGDNGA
jgi:hypothetical protein